MPIQVVDSTGKLKVVQSTTNLTSTATGTQNNWAPGIGYATQIIWSGASDLTVTGFDSGASGGRITFKNTGTKIAYFAHQSGSSSAGNKLRNSITSGNTPVAPLGSIQFVYDGADWQMVQHCQGSAITIPYVAGDFTGSSLMTWTVGSGDVLTDNYYVNGNQITMSMALASTSVGGTLNTDLQRLIPNGWTAKDTLVGGTCRVSDNGSAGEAGVCVVAASGTKVLFRRSFAVTPVNWSAATDATLIQSIITFPVN